MPRSWSRFSKYYVQQVLQDKEAYRQVVLENYDDPINRDIIRARFPQPPEASQEELAQKHGVSKSVILRRERKIVSSILRLFQRMENK